MQRFHDATDVLRRGAETRGGAPREPLLANEKAAIAWTAKAAKFAGWRFSLEGDGVRVAPSPHPRFA